MGSFCVKCNVSGITITDKQDCVMCLVKQPVHSYESKFARIIFPLVFGKYDDYGDVIPDESEYNKKINEYFRKRLGYSASDYRCSDGDDPLYLVGYVDRVIWDSLVKDSDDKIKSYRDLHINYFSNFSFHRYAPEDKFQIKYDRQSYINKDIEKYKEYSSLDSVPIEYSRGNYKLEEFKSKTSKELLRLENELKITPEEEFFDFLEDVFNDESLEYMFKELHGKSFMRKMNMCYSTTQETKYEEQIQELEIIIKRLKQLNQSVNWTTDWYNFDIISLRDLTHNNRDFEVRINPREGYYETYITETLNGIDVKDTYLGDCNIEDEAEKLVEEWLEEYVKPNARFRIIDCDTKKATRELIKTFYGYIEVPNRTGGDEDFVVMDTFRKEYIWCESGFRPFCSLYDLNKVSDNVTLKELENNRY